RPYGAEERPYGGIRTRSKPQLAEASRAGESPEGGEPPGGEPPGGGLCPLRSTPACAPGNGTVISSDGRPGTGGSPGTGGRSGTWGSTPGVVGAVTGGGGTAESTVFCTSTTAWHTCPVSLTTPVTVALMSTSPGSLPTLCAGPTLTRVPSVGTVRTSCTC